MLCVKNAYDTIFSVYTMYAHLMVEIKTSIYVEAICLYK